MAEPLILPQGFVLLRDPFKGSAAWLRGPLRPNGPFALKVIRMALAALSGSNRIACQTHGWEAAASQALFVKHSVVWLRASLWHLW